MHFGFGMAFFAECVFNALNSGVDRIGQMGTMNGMCDIPSLKKKNKGEIQISIFPL